MINAVSGTITSPIMDYLQELQRMFAGLTDGEVADYIPELAKAEKVKLRFNIQIKLKGV